jgi:DNA-binding transcriptional regulator YiaG
MATIIKTMRLHAGFKRAEDLASKLLVSVKTVRRWERGETKPPFCLEILLKDWAKEQAEQKAKEVGK